MPAPPPASAAAHRGSWRSSSTRTCPTSRVAASGPRAMRRPTFANRRVRHVAVRRGVAVGGDRDQLPAAAGGARSWRLDPVPDPGPVRPARTTRRDRALHRVPRAGPHSRPTSSTSALPSCRRGCARLALAIERSATRLRRRGGDGFAELGPNGRPARRRSAGTRAGPRRRPTRSCRCSRLTPALALQVQTGIAAHRRRFGDWGGGFWLPECGHARWLDPLLAEAGVRAACVELTDVSSASGIRAICAR